MRRMLVAESLPEHVYPDFGAAPPLPNIRHLRAERRDASAVGTLPVPESGSSKTAASEDDLEMGPVAAILTSTAAVGFFSSLTFHLLLLGFAILVTHLLGVNWMPPSEDESRVMGSLGDEDVFDDMAKFELVGELGKELEIPAGVGSVQQMAQHLQQSDSGRLKMTVEGAWNNIPGAEAGPGGAGGTGFLLKVPKSGLAVTKGNFTAFTIPANPKPRETYSIVIEVRLPDDVKQYRVSDLSGEVRGSDSYSQKIPYDKRTPFASGFPGENETINRLEANTVLDVVGNRVQIIIKVPGADRLVKDVIRVRSKKLKEEQELTLVFGMAGSTSSSEDTSKSTKSTKNE